MSVYALSWVLRHSEAKNGARLVLIALADFAHDDGSKAFPAVETLMSHTRLGRTAVKDGLRRLAADEMIVATGHTKAGTTVWRIVMGGSDSGANGRNPTVEGSESDPNPSVDPSVTTSVGNAPARKITVGGKPVDEKLWEVAVQAVAVFNEETGRRLSAVTGTGVASETGKRVYGRVRAFPELTIEQHGDIIRRTLRSRWWGDDEPSIGVVYGPRVFEDNIERPAPAEKKAAPSRFTREG